ncbi:MAG: nitrile hydratase subunit beta [Pseudomonadales bacterium]|nr:nitrile hydratase subunit beta [Pseudomonadales bacterium]NIX09747.1 nitrile hydratase subunit beta [Pseudomonadales bacterium]
MNGVHDLGGMTCFGPVPREEDEPVFHAAWERRVFAMNMLSMGYFGPLDAARHGIERMDPAVYLSTSYYEHWLAGIEIMGRDSGLLTDSEMASGTSAGRPSLDRPPLDPQAVDQLVRAGSPASRPSVRQPAFGLGDVVRARNLDVRGHTRLPRYVRGKKGTVTVLHGTHVFPDTSAHGLGEKPQPLYNVRFEADELWGDNVERNDCVYIDLWEDYLEPIQVEGEPHEQ